MEETPRLFDTTQIRKINEFLSEKNLNSNKSIGGMFDFFNDKSKVLYSFYFIFFLLICLFLYFRYQNKKKSIP